MKLDRTDDISAKDVKRLLLRVYRDLKAGDLSDTQAYREASILNNVLKAIELTDMEERLSKIERLIGE
jgi:23S rRNA maturation mini-RNase III